VSDESAEVGAWRAGLREWLAAHIPTWWEEEYAATPFEVPERCFDGIRAWQKSLFEAGYMGIGLPREYGGQGLGPEYERARAEELVRAGAPPIANEVGVKLCIPALLSFGTEEQKHRFIPGILSASEIWCQGYSEPGAGSDLASLQTRAVRDGDEFVVNGSKIWTTYGMQGDWIFCLVRTDPEVAKQAGIGFLLIDMKTLGVDARPIVNITTDVDFCQVFFEDVRVPASNLVGHATQGWEIANHVLSHERGPNLAMLRYADFLEQIAERARETRRGGRPLSQDPMFRQRWAACRIEFEVLRQQVVQAVEEARTGRKAGPASSLLKLQTSEFDQRLARLANEAQGLASQLWLEDGLDRGIWQWRELWSRAYTIFAGSSEIQRNIIAQRILGLPRPGRGKK
jgi:alkylation response protein AidB-like acyl-CoA dehydrogenase